MADDTTDVSTQTQTVLVLRYELNGKICERFWTFSNPERQDAEGLSKCILDQLNLILKGTPEKPIAQTYDGAAVMRGRTAGVNVKIKDVQDIPPIIIILVKDPHSKFDDDLSLSSDEDQEMEDLKIL
ncbi:hypothetical protein ILUMI_02508 [Ignelater luminosus]|uniref:DUF4371 domain-containing protein n=1 Tax=Ignelater luminosus TaxID=2038154 RepID=A0A8K0DI53_IGNLU|nr:hypothetical protein ILUMI_02508 [Ignelater luminosus]